MCYHPTDQAFYESYIDTEGFYEDYWCRVCNRWLSPAEVEEIRNRPEWVTWQTE